MQIGHKIKKVREIKGLTRDYVAAQIDMSVSNYSRLERDEISITLDKLQLISEVLNVNYLDILSFDEKQVFNFINSGSHSAGYVLSQHYNCASNDAIQELSKRIEDLEKKINHIK